MGLRSGWLTPLQIHVITMIYSILASQEAIETQTVNWTVWGANSFWIEKLYEFEIIGYNLIVFLNKKWYDL